MTLVIHDMDETAAKAFDFKDAEVIKNNGKIKNCIGCFGCWTRTPGECIIHDGYENMGKLLSKCDRLIIISRSCFGGYSPFVKNVFDRSISYVLPDFEIRGGEMHHTRRYDNVIEIELYMYGENITEEEKKTAENIVRANAANFDGRVKKILFKKRAEDFGGDIVC